MSNPASILIPHRNSHEAIELCIESIRKYTTYPYTITVWDDASDVKSNIRYLRQVHDRGWIELIEGKERLGHGGVLNRFFNSRTIETKYAVLLDDDIQIKAGGWLRELVDLAESDPMTIACVDYRDKDYFPFGFIAGIYKFWFGLINMDAYEDGMHVDWRPWDADRRQEPYKTEFSGLYTSKFRRKMEAGKWRELGFNPNLIKCDPGTALYLKIKYDNPRSYKALPLIDSIRNKYYHWLHTTLYRSAGTPRGDIKKHCDRMKKELEQLRKGG